MSISLTPHTNPNAVTIEHKEGIGEAPELCA